ncbi:MAG TPA: hypothetical protein VLL97_01040, partial [Acidobacteriota bacterium]|nr:hypothetical protein [Acidobacteriota bacterium]
MVFRRPDFFARLNGHKAVESTVIDDDLWGGDRTGIYWENYAGNGGEANMGRKIDRLEFRAKASLAGILLMMFATGAVAQEQHSFPAGSSPAAIERMVKLAELRDGDVVIDLGSYDGRIVLEALRSHPGVRGLGVDIDSYWVSKANEAAKEQGFGDRAKFFHRNAFDTDLSEVTVVKMWLYRSLTQLLRPQILSQARPGTRIIASGDRIDNNDMMGN